MSREAFIELMTKDQPDAPPYFTYDAVLNSRERPTLDETLARELKPLSLDDVLRAREAGAQLLDTRDPVVFGAAHLAGSINIGLGGQYATWAGTVLNRDTPIVIVADPGAEVESAVRLGRIGFDHVIGYLERGLAAAASRPEVIASIDRVSPERASELAAGGDVVLLDVRTPGERAAASIPGSMHVPLTQLPQRLAEVPADRPLLVFCAGGYRSSIAASLLARSGREGVREIAGGVTAWQTAGLPAEGS
jgi:rhodanese-related sulfurtransferase